MKKTVNIIQFVTIAFFLISCGSSKNVVERYEIEAVTTGTQSSALIKVWSYGKKRDNVIEKAKKNAVRGILFKGYGEKRGISRKEPLVSPQEKEANNTFFKNFLKDGGGYLRFVTLSNDGSIAASDRLRVGNEYKIGVIVSVQTKALREELERKGVIKKLGYGF